MQQLTDFKNDLRASADPRKTNTAQMIEAAKDMTDDEIKAAAIYFSSMKWTPGSRARGGDGAEDAARRQRLLASSGHGHRTDRQPYHRGAARRRALRAPRSRGRASLPMCRPGSLKKGAALVASGGGKTTPCGTCHGLDLNGLGPVPAIAGRSPSYLVRQLWDFKQGSRKGAWSPLMKPVVENLTQDDMLAIAAYVAAQGQ